MPASSNPAPAAEGVQEEAPLQDGIRDKLHARAVRALEDVLATMSSEQQLEALSQPSDYSALIEALLATDVPPVYYDRNLFQARLRGLEAKRRLASDEGGCVSARDLAEKLQVSRQAVEKRRTGGSLFAVQLPSSREWYYPLWQFSEDGALLAGFDKVLRALPADDPWSVMIFFLNTEAGGDETPLAALRKGRLEEVLRAARMFGEQVAT